MNESSNLESRIENRAIEEALKYIKGRTFKKKIEDEYKTEFKTLLKNAEFRAKCWAGIASLVIVGIFTIAIGLEYANTKEKLAEARIQYSKAKELIVQIKQDAASLKEQLESELKIFREASQVASYALSKLREDTTNLHGDLQRRMTDFETAIKAFRQQGENKKEQLQAINKKLEKFGERLILVEAEN